MLPWVSHQRSKMADDNQHMAQEWLDCHHCEEWLGPAERGAMCCGWLPKHERVGEPFAPWLRPSGGGPEPSICPGYAISLPEVRQAARALGWAERGMLVDFLGESELPPIAFDYLDILQAEIRAVEQFSLREARSRSRGTH